MSLETKGVTCAKCHAYLFPEDDIVYCPVCGAPHHRECYNESGHCALEELHGTDRQYDKIKAREEAAVQTAEEHSGEKAEGLITCGMCHEKYDFSLNACPKCGAPNIAKAGGSFVSFDFLGGVPADYDIGDGITADEAKRFVMANTQRYIPKFATLNKKNKASFNWLAFFFPAGWLFSRKMYKNGIITGLFTVISTLFYMPLNNAIYNLGFTGKESYTQMAEILLNNISKIGAAVLAMAMLGTVINLTVRLITAILGDYWYKNHTIAAIKTIRAESEDMDYDYRKKGGVNIFMFMIAVMAVQYLPLIIMSLI